MADDLSNKNIEVVSTEVPPTSMDTNKTIASQIIAALDENDLNYNTINSLVQSAQNREQSYELIDAMVEDGLIATVLETYAGDVAQPSDTGKVVWAESDNTEILNYVQWLLDSLNIDKQMYKWAFCLATYGDIYVRLFHKSDMEEDLIFETPNSMRTLNEEFGVDGEDSEKEKLNEDIQLRIYSAKDPYVPYVQMVDNPGEMFDLQKFGKTYGFIKAPVSVIQQFNDVDPAYNYLSQYKMNQKDVEIYDGTTFVHGCLENTNQRQPETVQIFINNDYDVENKGVNMNAKPDSMTSSYQVRRGQSLLYDAFKIWRELNLLELSALLNRLTKSAVVRILTIESGDMPQEQVQTFLSKLKEKIEQKAAINVGKSMQDYTAAGPIENTIYTTSHDGKGGITATTIGGDFDPKSLVDIEYFRDKLFGALGVPKQFFGQTGDSAGFNGGSSLTIISAEYGKRVSRIQAVLRQIVADIVNLFLIDRGMLNYVNKFRIKMQAPVTQEEIDKRSNIDAKVRSVGEIMSQLGDIDDPIIKLKIYKKLLGDAINNPAVISDIESYIVKKEAEEKAKSKKKEPEEKDKAALELPSLDGTEKVEEEIESTSEESPTFESFNSEEDKDKEIILEAGEKEEEDSYLPTPKELGIK